jgi:glycosyltransferase involved in cell wall biosynthesis
VLQSQKTLTVITITKNDLSGFLRTEESLIEGLDDPRVEWIVVDGGSSASTIKHLRENTRKISRFFETSLGIYESMNFAAVRSQATYLLFMNSGDRFTSKGLVELLDYLQLEQIDWGVAEAIAVNQLYEPLWTWERPKKNDLGFKLGFRSYCHQSTILNRLIFLRIGGFYEKSLFSDWQMSLKLTKISQPVHINLLTTEYLTGGLSAQQRDSLWALNIVFLRAMTYRLRFLGFLCEPFLLLPIYFWKKLR